MLIKSHYLQVSFKKAVIAPLILFLSGCTHTVAFQDLHYDIPVDKKSGNVIVVIDKSTLESVVSTHSISTALLNHWNAQPGKMLKQVADVEFPQMYNEYIFSNSFIEPPWKENTFQLVMTVPEYQFKNKHVYYTVRMAVFDESSKLMEKSYSAEGKTQSAKMFWLSIYVMKSVMRQSALDALQKIFKQIRIDLSNLSDLSELEPLEGHEKNDNEFYSPQGTVDSFEEGEDGYYSPQDSVDSFDEGEYEYYAPQD